MTVYCFSVVYMLKLLSKKFFVPPFCRTKCDNLEDTLKIWKGSWFMARIFLLCPGKSVQISRSYYLHVQATGVLAVYIEISRNLCLASISS